MVGAALAVVVVSACQSSLAAGPNTAPTTIGAVASRQVITPSTAASSAPSPTAPAASSSPPSNPTATPPTPASSLDSSLAPPSGHGLHWRSAGRKVRHQSAVAIARTAGSSIAMMWMNPELLSFRFIPGYRFPEAGKSRSIDNKPSSWVPRMAAAFNGAFELKDHAGGYAYNGNIIRPLVNGLATIVITTTGAMHVVTWKNGSHLPADALVVRQNLRPLVHHGKSMATQGDGPATWGLANGGLAHANRTALGERADGSIVFAYGSEVTAVALADALVRAGVREAVVLDMNKSWPTGFVYDRARHKHPPVGHRILPQIWRDPSTYYQRFIKDFIVATAAS